MVRHELRGLPGIRPSAVYRHGRSARRPAGRPGFSLTHWTGEFGTRSIRVQETRARSPNEKSRPIWEIPAKTTPLDVDLITAIATISHATRSRWFKSVDDPELAHPRRASDGHRPPRRS